MEDWNEKLITAAQNGDIEDLELSLQNGADIEYQGVSGWSALMWAARRGHLEICRLLIGRGCKIDITQGDGETALMWAAYRGHLEICRLLIDRGCKIDIIARDGRTALHYAAQFGHLQITRYLVEQGGASPLVTTHKGRTPYDLAAERMKEEVMEYLQTVMSEKSSGVTAEQGREGNMVPTEIKLMADKRSIDLYLKLLESGSEKKRDIRLVVVGKKGAGKTSLIRRLFGEDITDVTSTNGIEIHKIKCKAMSDDGVWNKQEENNEDTQTQARLLKQYVGQLEDKRPFESHRDMKGNTPVTSFDDSKKSEMESDQHKTMKPPEAAIPVSEPPDAPHQPNKSSDQAAKNFETMLSAESKIDVHDKEEYATFLLWDFAGDEEFYHTHQTFLSQDAMYLVVTKLNEADDHNAQALFRLWIDSIHCYSRLEERNNTSDKKPLGDNDPPVVIVGTWKDAVTSETDTKKIEIACRENLLKYTNELADDERGHVRCEYFISNKDDDLSAFQQIRQNILNLARGMRTWNKDYPLKFIQLEQLLQKQKEEIPIISYDAIKAISANTPMPLNEEELIFFLEFHHELRSLVYFKDLPDNIILDTQWLSDAFKCIVTAEKFQASTKNQKKWNEFYKTGKLNNEVLEDIFKKETTILYDHKEYILKVMENFDIIIRPNKSEGAEENPYYYVPCMIKAEPEIDIHEMFNVTKDIGKRSTWMCFRFIFLPPHLYNHLIASLSRKYNIAERVVTGQKERQIALFKSTAVFELRETSKLRKLLLMTLPNVIQIQVWEFGEEIKSGLYKYIGDFVTEELNTIMHSRFKMSNVKFEKTWECGLTESKSVTGSIKFTEKPLPEYRCDTCQETHNFIREWSDQQDKESRPPKRVNLEVGAVLITDEKGNNQTNILPENLPKNIEAVTALTSDIDCPTQTKIFPFNPPATELTPDKEGATQRDIIREIPYKSFEASSGLTSVIEDTTGTNIIQEKQPKNLEVATGLTSNKEVITQTSIIPENPLKSYEAASGFKSDTESTSRTQIISKKEHTSQDTKVDFSDILDQMITQLVISVDDRRSIEQSTNQENTMLDIVIKRGEPNKSVCIDILMQNSGYKDIAQKLKSDSSRSVPPTTKTELPDVPAYKIRLQKNYLEIINTLTHHDK
ncbi:uncharacterized protein LOC134699914 [Mytilus trossulus]|uniref:uncharacterized protein LOC134699914 n=1 Tax=Mytilus trossulus TaxID=6551 RepID=UPI003003BB84